MSAAKMGRFEGDPKEYENLSHRERMDKGYPYSPADPEICQIRLRSRRLIREYNASADGDHLTEERKSILRKLLHPKSNAEVYIEPNFRCEYGHNIIFGEGCFMNFDCCIMDNCLVTIGKNFMAGPGVQIYTATHPYDPDERLLYEYAKPVTVGDNVWIGGGAKIVPGVTVGNGVIIGAGSVVTKDVPDFSIVAGNPAKVIRHLDESEKKEREKQNSQPSQGQIPA